MLSIKSFALALVAIAAASLSHAATPFAIAGKPPTSLTATHSYTFVPMVTGATSTVIFQIVNKPVWLKFDTKTGRLYGTPTNANVGTTSGIIISAAAGTTRSSLPAFSIMVLRSDLAPTISGTPAASVAVEQSYTFKPTYRDQEGDALTFSIQGKPAWATFSTTSGQLSGTPHTGSAGTYANIVISVSDGRHVTALRAFSITVTQPVVMGSVILHWNAPTENVDGSPLTNLAGFHVYYGKDPNHMDQQLQLPDPGMTSVSIEELISGTYYFAVKAYNSDAQDSDASEVAWKTI